MTKKTSRSKISHRLSQTLLLNVEFVFGGGEQQSEEVRTTDTAGGTAERQLAREQKLITAVH